MTSGRGGSIVIEKDSVSFAPVASRTWIVNANTPSVVGSPVMPPELVPWVNNVVPDGIRPSTTLKRTGFSDVLQPDVEKNQVFSVPTFPFANVSGTIVQFEGGVGTAPAEGATTSAADSIRPAAINDSLRRAMLPPETAFGLGLRASAGSGSTAVRIRTQVCAPPSVGAVARSPKARIPCRARS